MKVKSESEVSQSCPTLRDPMDCSLPGSSVHGIFQARVLEWGAIAFSNVCARSFQSCLTLCDLWTVTHQAPLSMGILQARRLEWVDMSSSRESWKPRDQTCISFVSCIVGSFFTTSTTWEAPCYLHYILNVTLIYFSTFQLFIKQLIMFIKQCS